MNTKDIEFQSFLMDFKNHMSKLKIKNSIQRDYVLKVLYYCDKHLSAEEIVNEIKKRYNLDVGKVTIYNALKFFEEINLVKSLTIGNNPKKYELNIFNHHDHLICTKCFKIVEFWDEKIEQSQKNIAKKHNFLMQDHEMILYGLCENCHD